MDYFKFDLQLFATTYSWAGGKDTIALLKGNSEDGQTGTKYYSLTFGAPDGEGNREITLSNALAEPPENKSYVVVTTTTNTALKAGSVKINYVQYNEDPALFNLKKADGSDLQLKINAGATILETTDAGSGVASIDFDTRMTGVVNNVVVTNLKPGIKLTDATVPVTKSTTPNVVALEGVNYGYVNAITFDVTSLTYDEGEATVYIGDTVVAVDETTRIKTLSAVNGAGTPDYGYYTVTRAIDTENANATTYTVRYTAGSQGEHVDLTALGVNLTGATAIDLASKKDVAVTVDMTALDKVVNAVQDGTKGLQTLKVAGVGQTLADAETAGILVWTESAAFDGEIAFKTETRDIKTDGTLYYVVTKDTDKGVTTYTITEASNTPPSDDDDNYFKATYNNGTGAIELTYHPAADPGDPEDKITATEVAEALASAQTAIAVDGSTVVTTGENITKKLTLTETIPCDATDLPKTVKTVVNGTAAEVPGADYSYKDTYNVTTTIALGTTNQTQWYRVVVGTPGSKANYGVNTCTLATPVTSKPSATLLRDNNYVKVTTTGGNAISIQYLPATDATKAYDFNGQSITIDPTKAAANATITIYGNEETPTTLDNAKFVIKSLTKDQSVDTVSHGAGATADTGYQTSYKLTYSAGTNITGGDNGHIDLTALTDGTKYFYTVEASDPAANGVITYTVAQAANAAAVETAKAAAETAGHKFGAITVTNGTATGITVSYDGDDISGIGENVAIDASGAAKTVKAIDLSNGGTTINYALKDMNAGVEVVNPGKYDTYAQLTKMDLTGQTLKLGTEEKAFWTISADGSISKTTTEPTDGKTNYFAVTKPKDSNAYTIEYVEAGNGTAYDLTETALTIDASGVAKNDDVTVDLSNGTPVVQYNVTGAPAGLTVDNIGAKDTVSYSSTFQSWPTQKGTYTYFAATTDSAGDPITELKVPAAAVTVEPLAAGAVAKKFNKVTVTFDGTTYAIAITGVQQTATGVLTPNDGDRSIDTITVPSSYKNIDATALAQAGMVLAGVNTGDTVTVNATSLANLTISGTGSFTVTNITPNPDVSVTYHASTTSGEISVKAGKCVDGSFALAKDEVLTASDDDATVTVTGDSSAVAVTFVTGAIDGITGLGAGEMVTVTNSDGTSVTYEYDASTYTVTKKTYNAADPPVLQHTYVAGADNDGKADIINLNYIEAAAVTPLSSSTFKWTNGTYYVPFTGTAATIATVTPESTVTVTSGSYIIATVTGNTLTLTPVTGTSAGTVNKNAAFAGTITVNGANGVAITYDKDTYAAGLGAAGDFAVVFTNVADGSVFTHLDEGDKVTTATLAQGASVSVNTAVYTTAADGSQLIFEDGKIVSGTVTLTNGSGTLIGANEKISIATGGTTGVQVVFKNGAIDSITKFSKTDLDGVITLVSYTTDDEGVEHEVSTTKYTAVSDTSVTKEVVLASGDKETSTITIAKDGDILKPTADLVTALKGNLNMGADDSGYFEVNAGTGIATVTHNATPSSVTPALNPEAEGERLFVRATITQGTGTDPDTLTLTPVSYKKGVLSETGVDASKIKVAFTANTDPIFYDGSNNSFQSVAFTGVVADSVFTGLSKGDTVSTAVDGLDAGESITVNGTEYVALADDSEFVIYAENSRSTYIDTGDLIVTGEATSVDVTDPTKKLTLTYSTSSKADPGAAGNDGVEVTYASGIPSIDDLEDGEKVAILDVTENKTTTFERKGTYLYVTDEEGKVWGKGGSVAVPVYSADLATFRATLTGASYTDLTDQAPVTGQFLWSDTATKTATGYFLLSGTATKTATVADQSAKTSINYKNAGEIYVVASVTTAGALTLTTQEVDYDGSLNAGVLTGTQAVTVNGINGKKITYTRGAEKSITLNGVGKDTVITGAMTADDVVTTAALKAGDKVTIGTGNVFTAAADGVMSFAGSNATAGTFLLNTAVPTMTTTVTDGDSNVTTMVITYNKNTYAGDVANQNIAVTVSNGRITGVKGLDASENDNLGNPRGEQFTVVTTVTDKFGKSKVSTATYTASMSTETGKAGQVVVTRNVDGTNSTHTFADSKQNILDSTVVWATDTYVTVQNFDWTNTGYFRAVYHGDGDEKGKYTADIVAQGGTTSIPDDYAEGTIFLKVEATKASASSPSVISSMSLVKMEANGQLADFANGTVGTVNINASATAGGFELPAHSNKLVITGAQDKASYKGLNAADTIASATLGAATYTVNGTKYTLTAASAGFAMNGAGELTTGTFTIAPVGEAKTATAIGSDKPEHDGDNAGGTVLKSLVYTAGTDNKDGVDVTFNGGSIANVKDLEPGEQVLITQVKGTSMAKGMVLSFTKDDDKIVTGSIAIPGVSTPLTMTRTDNLATADILDVAGYKVSNKFDYGTTTEGKVGLFLVNAGATSVKAYDADAGLTLAAGNNYVVVDASQSSKNVTINALTYLNTAAGMQKAAGNAVLTNGITLTAPEEGNLTLANGAAQLYTTYVWDPTTKSYVIDTVTPGATEKSRTYTIAVTGAVAGKTYSGFGDKDTVTGSLVTGDDITVNGKKLTLAGDNAILIRGDGKAINGVYTLGSGVESASGIANDPPTALDFTAKVTGASAAVVKFAGGDVDSIKGVKAGETVSIVSTNTKTGAVSTTAYKTEAVSGSTDLKVTRTTTIDGVTTVVTGTVGATDSITDATWGAPTATLTSKFDWTSASGSGYFLTEVTDTSKKLGTIEVKPATTTAEVGKYYLKVALSADGVVSGLSLHKIKADGTPDSNVIASVTEGTINVTAPTASALTLDMTTAPAAVVFNVTGAAAKSVVTMDNAKDTLTTATLAAGEYVTISDTINAKKVMAGASGALEFTAGKLSTGVIEFTKDTAAADLVINTSAATITVSDTLGAVAAAKQEAETVSVVVKNGVVETISGITKYDSDGAGPALATTVTVLENGITSTYSTDASKTMNVNFAGLSAGKDLVTAKLAQGALLSGGGLNNMSVAEAGALTLHAKDNAQFQIYGGAVQFRSGAAVTTRIYVTGSDTSATTDDKVAVFTTGTGNNSPITVKVEKGVITSVKGLRKGDVLAIGEGADKVTYTAVSSTVITKEYTDASGAHKDTAYLSAVDGDIIGASYAVVSDDDITGNEAFEGQFSWADVSGRSTGYFKITDSKNASTATIAEQSTKSSPTAGKNTTVKYVKANTAEDENNFRRQILTIGALQVTNTNGVTKVSETDASKILTAGTKITVTAPTATITKNGATFVPQVNYTKTYADKYNVVINKVAAGSVIAGLTNGDKVTTNTLNAEVYTNGVLTTLANRVTMTDGKGDSIVYVAGAKGALEFLGEGASAEAAVDSENRATLVKGTILLDTDAGTYGATNKTAILSGSADGGLADITVALDDSGTAGGEGSAADKVLVTVAGGKVTSITGLNTKGNKLTLTPTGGTAITYEVLNVEPAYDAKGNVIANTQIAMVSRTEGTTTYYASFTVGKNIYGELNSKGVMTNGYKPVAADTPTNTDKLWGETDKKGQIVYVEIVDDGMGNTTAAYTQTATDAINAKDAQRGKKYLAMTVKTTNGVSTIQKLEVAEVDATGAMKTLTNVAVNRFVNSGVTIDGTNNANFAKINYTIPSTVPVTITNAAIGSVITGVKDHETWSDGDQITTANQTDYTLTKGAVTLYKVVDAPVDQNGDGVLGDATQKQTVETKVAYALKAKGDSAKIDVTDGDVTKLVGFETLGESVTITENLPEGVKTTVYEIKTVSKVNYVYKTVTNVDGIKKIYRHTVPSDAATYNWVADPCDGTAYLTLAETEVVSDFDWTMDKRDTGYFAVDAKGNAAVKVQTKPVTYKVTNAKDAAATYVALKISEDGVVESVKSVKLDTDTKSDTYGEMIDATSKFAGVINVAAPAKQTLTFDRSKVDTATTIDEKATMAVTGALKDSVITNLALGDTVTTAKLAKAAYNAKTGWTWGDTVTLSVADDANPVRGFTAGAAGALGFKVQAIDGDNKLSLTSGTIKLTAGEYAYVGDRMITMENTWVTIPRVRDANAITVAASTNKNGVTSYTIGELKEGEIFTVETFGSGASTKKYWRSANNLFCETTTGSGTTKAVYEIKAGVTIKSSVLELADSAGAAATKSNPWVSVTESNATFKETADEGLKLVSTAKNAAVTVDLKLLDSRIAADNKLYKTDVDYAVEDDAFGTNRAYTFVIDKYLANPYKFNGAASVIADENLLDMQEVIGKRVDFNNDGVIDKCYSATRLGVWANAGVNIDIAQSIKATNGWRIIGSLQNDTITGASSGKDTLNGAAGNDSLVGGGAADFFVVANGQDTVKSYATGKDALDYSAGAFEVSLTGADVLLWTDTSGDGKYGEGDNSVLVLGMGNKKAVTIGTTNYYFGSGKATKAETFIFDVTSAAQAAASKYYGKEGLNNALSIGTDKTKATSKTLGDTLTVDLSDATRYFNIAVADASKSGNKVDLKATDVGSTLKGGTYQSTLRGGLGSDSLVGGSGADTFWFEALDGSDTISGYAAAKDKLYVKEANLVFSDKDTAAGDVVISASGNDVVLTDAEGKNRVTLTKAANAAQAINIVTDAVTKESLSYYVGASTGKKANAFTATLDKDMAVKKDGEGKDTDELELKSYYVGSDAKIDDALKLASGKTVVANKKFNMNDLAGHLSSIDVIDTAGLAKGSTIELIGRESGSYTMKGSNNVQENFNLSALKDEKTAGVTNYVTITNLAVVDVITLGDNIVATKTSGASSKNTYFTLTDKNDSKTSYGTLCVTGVAASKFASSSYSGSIKRS